MIITRRLMKDAIHLHGLRTVFRVPWASVSVWMPMMISISITVGLFAVEQAFASMVIPLDIQTRDMQGEIVRGEMTIDPEKTAVVVIDMWDRHWCETFTQRSAEMIPQMNLTLDACRNLGIQVVFAPAEVVNFYSSTPQRQAMVAIPDYPLPPTVSFNPPSPPQPIDHCECGPDQPCPVAYVWTRQHSDLRIEAEDLIGNCTYARELLNLCQDRGINTLLYAGVASNMCVLYRPFGIINMKRYGMDAIVIGDLVKAITANGIGPNGQPDPTFTPELGTALALQHIEQYVAPSIDSQQLLTAVLQEPEIAVLCDHFSDGNPLNNDGVGANWSVVSSYDNALHAPHSEAGSEITLCDGAGNWNVGGIKNSADYSAGSTVSVVLTGFGGVDGNSETYDRGNGLNTAESASVNITDYHNNEGFPNAYANGGLAGISIEINYDPTADALGYTILNSVMANFGDNVAQTGVFDAAAGTLSIANPLIIEATPASDGNCTVSFNWTHDGGSSAAIETTLSMDGNGRLTNDLFNLALGAQGIGSNDGWVTFDSATVEPVVVIRVPGDANGDGKVDSDDAARLAANWLALDATWEMGDFNKDGIVDDRDATLLAANWQTGVVASASVPEPSMFIFMLGMVVVLLQKRRPS